jgi:hypothetical protein
MKLSSSAKDTEMTVATAKLADGDPLITMVDEVVGPDMVKAKLIIDAFGTKAGTRITLKQAPAARDFKSLSAAIKGDQYSAALRKGDILCFDQVYPDTYEGAVIAMVGQVTARTHDKMRGDIQLYTAMCTTSKASYRKESGPVQYLTMLDAKNAMGVSSNADVEKAWAKVKDLKGPGGNAGFIIRTASAQSGGDWFEKKGEGLSVFLSQLDQQDAFADKSVLELIPAWSLKMSRDQVGQDIDLRKETPATTGRFSEGFLYGDKRGRLGYLPCLVIVADEPETGFNSSLTGNVIRSAVGVQPCFRRRALDYLKVPTNLRAFEGTANGLVNFWSADEVAKLKSERVARRGPDAPIVTNTSSRGGAGGRDTDDDDDYRRDEYQPESRIRMGGRK